MPSPKFFRRPGVLLALCLCSVGAVVTLLGRLANGPQLPPKRSELTNEAGTKSYPAFSPDGTRVAYSGRGVSKDDSFHVYVRPVSSGSPQQLTTGPANDFGPEWSPDGSNLAFLRVDGTQVQCAVMPATGGAVRTFAGCGMAGEETQPFPAVSWMRDGKSLAVVQAGEKKTPAIALLSLDTGEMKPITHPPEGSEGDSGPAVSPDGKAIAFVRSTGSEGADIWLTDPAGAIPPRRLTFDDRPIRGLSFTPDAHDIVYAADRAGGWRLWRFPVYSGSSRDLTIVAKSPRYPAVAPAGNRLAFTESPSVSSIWRAALGTTSGIPDEHAVIRSTGRESQPVYSPDGKKIADISDQSGHDELWLCDADGGNRVQLTQFHGPSLARVRWSSDSKSLIFDSDGDHGMDLYTMPAAANAKPRLIQMASLNGSWSHDGKTIYFQSREQIWKATADGGDLVQLSKQPRAAQPVESLDGKYVYYRKQRTFWRVPAAGGEEEEFIVPEHDLLWTTTIRVGKKGIYYLELERSTRSWVVSLYDLAAKKSSVVFRMRNADWGNLSFSISPDEKSILYPKVDQSETNLVLIDNFR